MACEHLESGDCYEPVNLEAHRPEHELLNVTKYFTNLISYIHIFSYAKLTSFPFFPQGPCESENPSAPAGASSPQKFDQSECN